LDGTFSLLIGPNGIGKTTVLRMVEFLADPYDADPRPLFDTQFHSVKLTYIDGKAVIAKKVGHFSRHQLIDFSFLSSSASFESENAKEDFLPQPSDLSKTRYKNFFDKYLCVFQESQFLYDDSFVGEEGHESLGEYAYLHQMCRLFHADHVDDTSFLVFLEQRFVYKRPTKRNSYVPFQGPYDCSEKKMHSFQRQFRRLLLGFQDLFAYYSDRAGEFGGWPDYCLKPRNILLIRKIKEYNLPFFTEELFRGSSDAGSIFSIGPNSKRCGNGYSDCHDPASIEYAQKIALVRDNEFSCSLELMSAFADACNRLIAFVSTMGLGRVGKTLFFTKKGTLMFRPVQGHPFGFECLSTGEKNYISLLFTIVFESTILSTFNRSSIYLIDEPEISMHVGMQEDFSAKLQQICAETGCQIICATHSPYMAVGDPNLFAKLDYHFPEEKKK
jgi:energy-coupling factor transporter ATP-binding protein EcfA2